MKKVSPYVSALRTQGFLSNVQLILVPLVEKKKTIQKKTKKYKPILGNHFLNIDSLSQFFLALLTFKKKKLVPLPLKK